MQNKLKTIAGLCLISLLATTNNTEAYLGSGGDFGRAFGANGYIPNMPLYFGQHRKKGTYKPRPKCQRCRVCSRDRHECSDVK